MSKDLESTVEGKIVSNTFGMSVKSSSYATSLRHAWRNDCREVKVE